MALNMILSVPSAIVAARSARCSSSSEAPGSPSLQVGAISCFSALTALALGSARPPTLAAAACVSDAAITLALCGLRAWAWWDSASTRGAAAAEEEARRASGRR